jgi:inosose dehydratase
MDGAVSLRAATGPVSWGVDFAGAADNPPWTVVLDGVRAAGFAGVELGPLGYLPEDPAELESELAGRGLTLVGGFLFEPLHDPARLEDILALARRTARLVAAVGGRRLVAIDLVSDARARTVGRPELAPRLRGPDRGALLQALARLADVAREWGLGLAVHPHAGSYVEFSDEIAAVAEVAPLCLDTGHLALAGLDPAAVAAEYADRTALLHLKDVDPAVRAAVVGEGRSFWDAVAAGVFCPLGTGMVDLGSVAQAVRALAHVEWATIEQDRVPGGDPVADLRASRHALAAAGVLGEEAWHG